MEIFVPSFIPIPFDGHSHPTSDAIPTCMV